MLTLKVEEFITIMFLIFEFELMLNLKNIEKEKRKYLTLMIFMLLPAVLMSINSILVSFSISISHVLINTLFLTIEIIVEGIIIFKRRAIDKLE